MSIKSIANLFLSELQRLDEHALTIDYVERRGAHAWFSPGDGTAELLVPETAGVFQAMLVGVGGGDVMRAPCTGSLMIGDVTFHRFYVKNALAWDWEESGKRPAITIRSEPAGFELEDDYLVFRDLATQEIHGDDSLLLDASRSQQIGTPELVAAVSKIARLDPTFLDESGEAVIDFTQTDTQLPRKLPLAQMGLCFEQLE